MQPNPSARPAILMAVLIALSCGTRWAEAGTTRYVSPNPAANYLWDLGDGLPVTTSSTSFTYSNPGTYQVGLVVWDSLGRAAHDEFSLTVMIPEPSSMISIGTGGLVLAIAAAYRTLAKLGEA